LGGDVEEFPAFSGGEAAEYALEVAVELELEGVVEAVGLDWAFVADGFGQFGEAWGGAFGDEEVGWVGSAGCLFKPGECGHGVSLSICVGVGIWR
jgi:hypothetical protein